MTALQVATARLYFHLCDNLIASSLVESGGGATNIGLNYSSTTTNNGTYSSTLSHNTTPNKDIVANQISMASTWDSNSDSGMAKSAYGLFTMMHEIGHALGLPNPGTYNGSAIYATDAVFVQDNRQYTVCHILLAKVPQLMGILRMKRIVAISTPKHTWCMTLRLCSHSTVRTRSRAQMILFMDTTIILPLTTQKK